MSDLTGKTVKSTYKDLLQVPNNNAGVDATMRTATDGEGTASALQVSTTGVKSSGTLEVGNLPTADPSKVGQLWNVGGFIIEGASPLQYDSGTGSFGFGGAHAPDHKYKFHGDLLIEDSTATEATLTVRQDGSLAATLRLEADSPTVVWKDDAAATDESFIHLGYGSGTLSLASYNDNGTLKNILVAFGTDGEIKMFNLPTTDPLDAGQLWIENNQVKVSTGSPVSRYLYDSGWVSSWGANTLGPNERGVVVMPTTVDGYFPFQVNVWWRSSSGSTVFEQLDSQPKLENGATLSSGLEVFYDSSTRELYIDTQDVALYGEVTGGGSTSNGAWSSGTNQIRVTIT
jgi:hypothetical protein